MLLHCIKVLIFYCLVAHIAEAAVATATLPAAVSKPETTIGDEQNIISIDGRIVGGSATDIFYYPHQISLQRGGRHVCGGSIIDSNIILTAAHCVIENLNPSSYRIRAGSTLNMYGGQVVGVLRIYTNSAFSRATLDSDTAILFLTHHLAFNNLVKPIALATSRDILAPNDKVIVTGWGLGAEEGNVSPGLQHVGLRSLNQNDCERNYAEVIPITANMFCAGHPGRDSCQGDSGGPLVSYNKGVFKLVGIVSWGIGCGNPMYPGVYAKVSALRPWIDNTVREIKRISQ